AGVEGIVRRLIGEDIRLGVDFYPQIGNIKTDPGQLEQVILNLIINARDAVPQGGAITIQTARVTLGDQRSNEFPEREVPSGTYALLSITDTGIGMDESTQARLFEPFFTTKPQGKGSGLGLAMVHGIVKQAHGYIKVHSQPGAGSIFRLYFPIVE